RSKEIYDGLLAMARTDLVSGWHLAIVAVGLKCFDDALDHLERAMERREPTLLMLRNLPWFEPLAPRARFRDILARLGLDSRGSESFAAQTSERGSVPLRNAAFPRAAVAPLQQLAARAFFPRP
ncbi:MAG TPA: hypothetical protein VK760_01885, partial [Candidatus Acidoferrales bacterium]|nr:hypothetical protein [Candidatus Acidoferrales bacterium]